MARLTVAGAALALAAALSPPAQALPQARLPARVQATPMWWIPVELRCVRAAPACTGRFTLHHGRRLIGKDSFPQTRSGRSVDLVFLVAPEHQARFQRAGRLRLKLRGYVADGSGSRAVRRTLTVVAPKGGDPERGWFRLTRLSGESLLSWSYSERYDDAGCVNSVDAGGEDRWTYRFAPAASRVNVFTGIDVVDLEFGSARGPNLTVAVEETVDGHDVTTRTGSCDPEREPPRTEADRGGCGQHSFAARRVEWIVSADEARRYPGPTGRLELARPGSDFEPIACPGPRDWQRQAQGPPLAQLRDALSGDAADTVPRGPGAPFDFDAILTSVPIGASRDLTLTASGEWPLPTRSGAPGGAARLTERVSLRLERLAPTRKDVDGRGYYWPFKLP